MFRSALASALRYLLRGKLYAAISVFGLAVGLSMALLAALFIRSEYVNEHFVAGYQDLYLATTITTVEGRRHNSTQTPEMLAALIKERFPQVVSASRMSEQGVILRLGNVELGAVKVPRRSPRSIRTSSQRHRCRYWLVIPLPPWRGLTPW